MVKMKKRGNTKSAATHSFTDLLVACKQSWFNSDFNENNFPLESISSDELDWEVHEYRFDRTVNGLDAFKKLKKLGYRLCGPRRAMEYIAKNPDIQLNHPLITTVHWEFSKGFWCAPVFNRNYDKRYLNFYGLDDDFGT